MASSIITFIICIVAIVAKAYFKREADAFEANRPGQSIPEPAPHESSEIEHADDHLPQAVEEKQINHELYREAVKKSKVRNITTPQNSQSGKTKEGKDQTPLEGKNERPRLHTPEEARRAFIYSEIFTRKYE